MRFDLRAKQDLRAIRCSLTMPDVEMRSTLDGFRSAGLTVIDSIRSPTTHGSITAPDGGRLVYVAVCADEEQTAALLDAFVANEALDRLGIPPIGSFLEVWTVSKRFGPTGISLHLLNEHESFDALVVLRPASCSTTFAGMERHDITVRVPAGTWGYGHDQSYQPESARVRALPAPTLTRRP